MVITDLKVIDAQNLFTGLAVRLEVGMERSRIEAVRGLDLLHVLDLF